MTPQLTAFVDVDDTFVRSTGSKRIPMPRVLAHIRALHHQGVALYCWSSGGAAYARESAKEFGVAACFAGFLPKPNLIIDDQAVSEWRTCIEIHPTSIQEEGVEKYRADLQRKIIHL